MSKKLIVRTVLMGCVFLIWFGASNTALALVNINTANSDELQTLAGVGQTYADRIVDYRAENGDFKTIDEIKNVKGIGDATFNKFKDSITVEILETDIAVDSSNSNQQSSNQNSSSMLSTHYNAAPANTKNKKLSIDAGRDRLGSVGSPMEFRVEGNADSEAVKYTWTFGDGTEDQGEVTEHTYEYPGNYIAVVNAYLAGERATARVNVTVIAADISIRISPDAVSITNNSKEEVNLFGRALVSSEKIFKFPIDTIVKPNQQITFPAKLTGIYATKVEIRVVRPDEDTGHIMAVLNEERETRIRELSKEISSMQELLIEQSVQGPVTNRVQAGTFYTENSGTSTNITNETAAAMQAVRMAKGEDGDDWLSKLIKFFSK